MPRRTDITRVLVIGSGPIVIGQACEFDYSGTQACKALRAEGLEVVLVNSNPATIMTDPEVADRTYVEPLTWEVVRSVIERERPDVLLPTVGGQTALNLAVDLDTHGVLEEFGVSLIGASIDAITVAEDRSKFREAMQSIDIDVLASAHAKSVDEALSVVERLGFPAIIRPSFTLGGVGGGIAYNLEELREVVTRGIELSPVHEILIEESVIGWKEFELEVMRDVADNFVVVCSIENIDPMGVHTGDSITVAPALTLTDKEYQRMRDAARRIIRRVGVDTGGSNIQFAVDPSNGRMVAIEMNPRVSRSSALASKATGFPIAKIAAKLALGYRLDEIPNDITRLTPASFEPDPRLRRRQGAAVDLREVPTGRPHPDDADEVGRRGDGDRPDIQGGVSQGVPVARARPERPALRADAGITRGGGGGGRRGAATPARGADRPPHVRPVPGTRARLERRSGARVDQDRPVVPHAVRGDRRAVAVGECRRVARDVPGTCSMS